MTVVPTKGAVLKWARLFRGLSEEDAAEKLGITVTDLLAYERDEKPKQPSVTTFEEFASKYRLPQATLFLPSPPETPGKPKDFRSVGGERANDFSFDFNVACSNVRGLLFQMERLATEDEDFVPPDLPIVNFNEDPSAAGERERKRLNIPVDDQFSWDQGEAFRRWRVHLEKQGVLVFQQKFPLKDGRGFSLYDSKSTPTIVVNKDEPTDTAKAFTVWHEYCHLLLRQPGVSDLGNHPVESFCNKFAAAFLMPSEALRRLLPTWPNKPVNWNDSDISRWARKLKVSRRALALRLVHLGLAPDDFAGKYAWTTAAKRPNTGRGPDPTVVRLSELGSKYAGRLLTAYDSRVIDGVLA